MQTFQWARKHFSFLADFQLFIAKHLPALNFCRKVVSWFLAQQFARWKSCWILDKQVVNIYLAFTCM